MENQASGLAATSSCAACGLWLGWRSLSGAAALGPRCLPRQAAECARDGQSGTQSIVTGRSSPCMPLCAGRRYWQAAAACDIASRGLAPSSQTQT